MAINVITGAYTSEEWWGEVRIDGEVLSPEQSLRVMRHSPDGFAWGYRGSGPAQLALALMLRVLPEREALSLYHEFADEVIAELDSHEPFTLRINLAEWVEAHRAAW